MFLLGKDSRRYLKTGFESGIIIANFHDINHINQQMKFIQVQSYDILPIDYRCLSRDAFT